MIPGRRSLCWAPALGLAIFIQLTPSHTTAQTSPNAADNTRLHAADDSRFNEAAQAYRQGQRLAEALRWEDALPHFAQSFELYPNYSNSFGLARALHQVQRLWEARAQYESFLRDFSSAPEELRGRAQAYLQAIAARRRSVRLHEAPREAGLTVRVNGAEAEFSEIRPLLVEAFDANVAIILDSPNEGRFSWSGRVPVGETLDVEVAFDDELSSGSVWRSPLFWVITGALLAGGATTAGLIIYRNQNILTPETDRIIMVGP